MACICWACDSMCVRVEKSRRKERWGMYINLCVCVCLWSARLNPEPSFSTLLRGAIRGVDAGGLTPPTLASLQCTNTRARTVHTPYFTQESTLLKMKYIHFPVCLPLPLSLCHSRTHRHTRNGHVLNRRMLEDPPLSCNPFRKTPFPNPMSICCLSVLSFFFLLLWSAEPSLQLYLTFRRGKAPPTAHSRGMWFEC